MPYVSACVHKVDACLQQDIWGPFFIYKNDHFELKRLRDEYNETITRYQTQVKDICDTIKDIKVCDIEFIRNNDKIISSLFSIKSILHNNSIDAYKRLKDIDNIINNL